MAKKKAARPAARKAKAGIRNARQASAAPKKAARPATRTAGAKARKVGAKRPTAGGGRGAASRKSATKATTRVTKKTARVVTKPSRRVAGAAKKRTTRAAGVTKKRTVRVARPVARKVPAVKKAARPAVKKKPARAVQLPLAPAAASRPKRPPTLDRARKVVTEPTTWAGPPSSLDFDRHASAARTGHDELEEKLHKHTSTSPALSAGDVDADWASAESSGDETPGGDNPTPDQDVVDEIGRALGVEYDDNEELQGGVEIVERDRHRWELDPASREDTEPEEPED